MTITSAHYEFAMYFVRNCIGLIRRDDKARKDALDTYNTFARRGRILEGVRESLTELCGACEFPDEVLKDFAKAVRIHLNGIPQTRRALSKEEKLALMDKCGMRCPKCGKLLYDVNFDHVLPFFIVFDTMEMSNRQCLCADCNRDKAAYIEQMYA